MSDIICRCQMFLKIPATIVMTVYDNRLKQSDKEGRKCFYLTTHSIPFIYGYMADIW